MTGHRDAEPGSRCQCGNGPRGTADLESRDASRRHHVTPCARQVSRASSRTHLGLRGRLLRVQTARLRVRPRVPGTPTRRTPAINGDVPPGRVRLVPVRDLLRVGGQESGPRRRRMPPGHTEKSPHARDVPGRAGARPRGAPAQLRCRARTARRRSRAAPPGPWARSHPRRRPASPPAHRATC